VGLCEKLIPFCEKFDIKIFRYPLAFFGNLLKKIRNNDIIFKETSFGKRGAK